ncbi:ATP-dependent sacrificial sulfur transferase LarE [Planctomycetota bacterium]
MDLQEKYNSLKQNLKSLGKVVVAYSGGVDSTFLLKVAVDTLGSDNVLACIGVSASLAGAQHDQAVSCAEEIRANTLELDIKELSDSRYSANKADRCFHCKSHLFSSLQDTAKEHHFENIVCGSNFDDKDDYRPGNRAAQVFGIHSPLMDAQLTKADIRQLSRQLNLPTADVPASPCLASRISYGLEVTEERLKQVEQAEDFLRSLGLAEFRVRHHKTIARIEVHAEDMNRVTIEPARSEIIEKFKSIGFKYVTVDLQGFRSGSLNESLSQEEKRTNR